MKTFDEIALKMNYSTKRIFYTEKGLGRVEEYTLQGEIVKSLEEVTIANFLYLNGIEYEYEREYAFPVGDKYSKKYNKMIP